MLVYEHKTNGRKLVPDGVSILSEEEIVLIISGSEPTPPPPPSRQSHLHLQAST